MLENNIVRYLWCHNSIQCKGESNKYICISVFKVCTEQISHSCVYFLTQMQLHYRICIVQPLLYAIDCTLYPLHCTLQMYITYCTIVTVQIIQYIILKDGILIFNSFNITSKQGLYFTVHFLVNIRTNRQ